MDFKSLLQTMDNISETVHKAGPGGYGNRHGSETQTDQYGKPIGKVSLASLAPKDDKPKKRGAPVKADKPLTGKDDPKNKKVADLFGRTTGDVPKGKKGTKVTKMADADKEEKKAEKKSLKDWIEVSEHNQLNEEDVSVKPIQASQIIGADGKSMGTADPATANAIKAAAEKGTLNLSGDDSSSSSTSSTSSQPMTEKSDKPVKTDASAEGKYKGKSKSELLKAFKHLKKTGPHAKDSTQYGNMKELAVAIRAKGDSGKEQEKAVGESEGGYRGRDAYSRDEYSATTGFDKKDSQAYQQDGGANDEGWEDEKPKYPRTSDRMRQAKQRHYGFKPPRSESIGEGEGNFEKALDKLSGSWSGWYKDESSDPNIEKYFFDDGEGGYDASGTIEHNLQTGQVYVNYRGDEYHGPDVEGTFDNFGEAMRALRGGGGSHGGKARNFDRLGDREPYTSDDLYKSDRVGRKGSLSGGASNKLKQSIQFNKGRLGPKGVLPETKDLPGDQDELDVKKPFGKLTGPDFKALSKKKKVKEDRTMQILEGINFKELMASADSEVQEMLIELQDDVEMFKKTGHTSELIDSFLKVHLHHSKKRITDEAAGAGRGSVNPPAVNPSAPLPPARSAAPGWGRDDYKPLVPFDTSPKSSMGTIKGGVWTADPPKRGERGVPIPMDLEAVPEGNFLSTLGQSNKTFESKIMKDIQLESWEKELNSLLTVNEGITVSTSTGQQGSPDSVSVNATDGDSAELLQVLRQAGLGVFGGEEERSSYGSPMHSQEPTGAGSEPEMSPAVVGDGNDMMALIKKMSGIQDGGEPEGVAVVDVSSEEGEDEHSHYGSDNHNHEEQGEEEVDEGNFYAHNVLKAKKAGETEADLDGDGDMEQVKEQDRLISKANSNDGTVSTSSSTGRIQATMGPNGISVSPKPSVQNGEDSNKKAQKQDESHDHKDHETCNECGMYEARCVCEPGEEQVEEDYANEAGHEEMASLKHLLNAGNDMHYPKEKQSVGNPTQVTYETKLLKDSTSLLQDFRKLSGIK